MHQFPGRFSTRLLVLALLSCAVLGCSRPARNDATTAPFVPAPQAQPVADLTFADDAGFEAWLATTFRTSKPQTPSVNKYHPVPAMNAFFGVPFHDADPPWILKLPAGEVCFAGKGEHGKRREVKYSPPSDGGLLVCRWLDPDAKAYFAAIGRIQPGAEVPFRFGVPQLVPLNGLDNDKSDIADWDKATFSHDGKLMLRLRRGHGMSYYSIDVETLAWRELSPSSPQHTTHQVFLPGGRLVRQVLWVGHDKTKTPVVSIRPYLGFDDSGLLLGDPVTATEPVSDLQIKAASADGELLVLEQDGDPQLWKMTGTSLTQLSGIPPAYNVYSGDNPHFASGRLAMSRFGDAYVYDVDKDGKVTETCFLHKSAFKSSCRACILSTDTRQLFVMDFEDHLHAIDLSTLSKSVRIGQDLIRWQTPSANNRAATWPNVHLTTTWSRTGDQIRLDIVARNDGHQDAQRVTTEIDWEAENGASARCGTVYIGTVPADSEVRRRAIFAAGTNMDDLCLYRAMARVLGEFPVTPSVWLQVPAGVNVHAARQRADAAFGVLEAPKLSLRAFMPDSAAYHARVKQIYDAGYEILAELTGRRPECTCRPVGLGIGFMCAGQDIQYQNPFEFSENDYRINRGVIQTCDREELAAHAQMMPYWFIPHELVHAFDNRSGSWNSEYVANMIQPWLTERILQRIKAPYDAQTMSKVYDRYVAVLRRTITRAEADSIHGFAIGDGSGRPFEKNANAMFFDQTSLYVYFGAVVNQHSLRQDTSLEKLVEKHLK